MPPPVSQSFQLVCLVSNRFEGTGKFAADTGEFVPERKYNIANLKKFPPQKQLQVTRDWKRSCRS